MPDLTIILLLKNRQEYNYRFISHFIENSSNLNLFISDGSKKKIMPSIQKLIKKNKKIRYFKYPEDKSYEKFYKKVHSSLKCIKTKFVLFAANDDFLVYKNIFKCLNFLKNNKNYIGSGGTMLGFTMIKKGAKDSKLSNIHTIYKKIDLNKDSKLQRFNLFINNFSDLPRNSIIQKKVLVKNYSLSSKLFGNDIELKDHFSALFNVIHGKIKIFNKPLILHQTHQNSEGSLRHKNFLQNYSDKNFIKNLVLFDKILSKKLNYKKNYVLKNYFQKIVGNVFKQFSFKNEPSSKEIYNIFLKKLKRKLLKKDINKKDINKNLYLQKKNLSEENKKIIEEIEFFLKKI
ncbi:MAG: TIGR00180 family glycosyltransferase [Pelagibacterales bacterium]|nr:TIGR00180 family glycosyltransferase [Pelagibacterales bacterium]